MYIPKNRIKPNLYTPGSEYMIKSSNENYSGYYHSLWNGKFYTGKTQNDSNIRELIIFQVPEDEGTPNLPQNLTSKNVIALFLEDPDPLVNKENWNQKDIVTYLNLQGKSTIDDDPKSLPFQSYPIPTKDDYKLGEFTRYFVVKINQLEYLELNQPTYNKLIKKDNNWLWEMYIPFTIQWELKGDPIIVSRTNRNQTLIAEQRLKRQGLESFLRKNYLKFFKEETSLDN